MQQKLRVGVFFGGCSAEHEISLMSAVNVINALDSSKYEIIPIGVDRNGKMFLQHLLMSSQGKVQGEIKLIPHINNQVVLVPGTGHGLLVNLFTKEKLHAIDIAFPIMHGSYGEDGTIQGVIKAANVPFVGSDLLSSAICMDKDIAKRLLRDGGYQLLISLLCTNTVETKLNLSKLSKSWGFLVLLNQQILVHPLVYLK